MGVSRASRKKGADPKPTPVRNVAKATEGLHLVLGASFGRIFPRATRHHAIPSYLPRRLGL